MRVAICCGLTIILATIIAHATATAPEQCQFIAELSNQTSKPAADFIFQLYAKISAANPNKNIVYSPVSIALALALLEAGAGGRTQTALKKALVPTGYDGDVSQIYQSLQRALQIREDNVTLNIANSLYYKNELPLKEDYLRKVRLCFETEISNVDFKQTEAVRQKINQWISDKTVQKIPELLKPGILDENTVAVLANAIYLKAAWQNAFTLEPRDSAFHRNGQAEAVENVQFMTRLAKYPYAENNDFQLVEIPYKNVPLSMVIIIAKPANTGIQAVESKLTADTAMALFLSKYSREVSLKLPPFTFRLPTKLTEILKQLGMAEMFTNEANFSRMDTSNAIKVSDVVHEAYIKVNENGTEAAAATAVIMTRITSFEEPPQQPIQFIADYPFMFAIVHKPTRAILFHGKVNSVKTE